MIKNTNIKKRILAVSLATLMVLSGCAKKEEVVPELIEPVTKNDSFRPVDYGAISAANIDIADVVPEDYCVFYNQAAVVDEICADLGQYVEEGTVLAKMNTDELTAELAALQQDYQDFMDTHNYQNLIVDENVKQQQLYKQTEGIATDTDAQTYYDNQIAVLEENRRFDNLLYEHQALVMREKIQELTKSINESELIATHSGYVTYIKDLSVNPLAEAYENVVVISDYNDLHLEISANLDDVRYKDKIGKDFDYIYTKINGEELELTYMEYLNEELAAMQNSLRYGRIRFTVDGINELFTLGDKVPVYFSNKNDASGLRVGIDSVYTDGTQKFVYVKTENGKERRNITVGKTGSFYVEVKDGLSEGEWVCYTSTAAIPTKYEEYDVVEQEFVKRNTDPGINAFLKNTIMYTYKWNKACTIDEIFFEKNDSVNKGDLVCTLKTKSGYAKRVELKIQLDETVENNKAILDSYDAQISEIDQQIAEATQLNLASEVQILNSQRNILTYQRQIAEINNNSSYRNILAAYEEACRENDGNGKIYIYAEQDGYIGKSNLYEDKELTDEPYTLFTVFSDNSNKICFVPYDTYEYVGVGSKVNITDGNYQFELEIIGIQGTNNKNYVTHKNGKVYLSNCLGYPECYMSKDGLPEDFDFKKMHVDFTKARIQNAIMIPKSLIYTETIYLNVPVTYQYVWKIIDGEPVKQYVQIQDGLEFMKMVCVLDGLNDGDVIANMEGE